VQGRWSLAEPVFRGGPAEPGDARGRIGGTPSIPEPAKIPEPASADAAAERRRTLAELLLERYGIVTREQVLAEGIKGGFAMLYDTFSNLETLGLCRRGYFIEGMGGAQFALPGAVERLRALGTQVGAGPARAPNPQGAPAGGDADPGEGQRVLVLAAADPAQPFGAAFAWPKREGLERRPARVAGAYVVLVDDEPVLYVERGGRGLLLLAEPSSRPDHANALHEPDPIGTALRALAAAVRGGQVPKLSLERIDGEPAMASSLGEELVAMGFQPGPRRLTLSA
jgi:ATP-dependent Lhr-like helicase